MYELCKIVRIINCKHEDSKKAILLAIALIDHAVHSTNEENEWKKNHIDPSSNFNVGCLFSPFDFSGIENSRNATPHNDVIELRVNQTNWNNWTWLPFICYASEYVADIAVVFRRLRLSYPHKHIHNSHHYVCMWRVNFNVFVPIHWDNIEFASIQKHSIDQLACWFWWVVNCYC